MEKHPPPLTLDEWLALEDGRAAAMARHFDVTQAAINSWRKDGVPLRRMKAIRDYTGGAVTLEKMVPEPSRNTQQEA